MFKNKVVIITGGSSGIGAAAAIQFAKENAQVVIVGRNETKLASIAEECAKFGEDPLVINADVSKDEEANTIIERTINHFGRLDVLVNNAGTSAAMNNIEDTKLMEVYDKVMGVNLRSVFLITQLAMPELIKTKGNVINISSVFGVSPVSYSLAYSTSKAGMIQFSKCLALEMAKHGVRVNVVTPGPVATDFIINLGFDEEISNKAWKSMGDNTPLVGVTASEEVADLILFLASDRAKSITGGVYAIDRGTLLVGSEAINANK